MVLLLSWFSYSDDDIQCVNTCAKNGVMMAPNRAAAEQYPIAVPLTLVGYTSGVYTYTVWNTPVAKARMKNRKKVMTFLQGKEVGESVRIPLLKESCIN